MRPNSRRPVSAQTGFTLVEIMVGLAIGMLATVVIIQVISVFEAQSRTTTGAADAQTNGAIALYNLGREMQMAGYPLIPVTNSPLECTTLTINGVADATTPNRLSPVAIVNGVAAGVSASDAITIRYGNAAMGGVPARLVTPNQPNANDATVSNNFGCQAGDITLITNGGACTMSTATAVSAAGATPITITLTNAPIPADAGANIACLGTRWNEITYRASGGNLERCDLTAAIANGGNCNLVVPNANFIPSVVGVVNVQMQYGISATPQSNQIVRWVNAKNILDWVVAEDGVAPAEDWGTGLTVANRNRIKAVRIAVVARTEKKETAAVTTACSSITAAAPTGLCAWDATSAVPTPVVAPYVASPAPTIDLSADDADWLRYRYRVFENIIPLRNMIWAKDTL